jgi:putative ABC transport system ATP-binding protein
MTQTAILATRSLGKRFGALRVLEGVSIRVSRGESVAVTGPSGSGKSTLLGLLAGLEEPSEGEVFLEGQSITAMDEERLAAFRGKHIGFVFQSFRLLPTLSALENVRVPLDLAGRKGSGDLAMEWLRRVGLEKRSAHLPGQLSGGEQQRVALARALAPKPSVLLADEPTGNLDSKTGAEMKALLFSLVKKSGSALVLVTHDLALARSADRVIRFKDGRIAS